MTRREIPSRWLVLGAALALALTAQVAAAADRVNVMPDRQVRPGVTIPMFGNATDALSMPGDGSANGDDYTWSCAPNPDVLITDDGDLTGTVTDDHYIPESVSFTLLGGSTRELVSCTLEVDDPGTSVDTDTVTIDIVDATDPISDTALEDLSVDVNIALQEALRYMYLAQQQTDGRWIHLSTANWDCATTGFAVWALANSGHLPTNDVDDDIYAEFVQKGVDYILSLTSSPAFGPQPNIGDPDGDLNGRILNLCPGSVSTRREGYSSPIAAAGIIAAYSDAPGTLVAPGSFAGQLPGDTYVNVIQDAIDWIAFGQHDTAGASRGGWRYSANYGSADTSADSWSYVAMEGFEAAFGGSALELVKQEAERRIDSSQAQGGAGDLGQFGYTGTSPIGTDGNATTGGGLSGLVMVTAGGRVPPLLDGGALSSATFPDSATRKAAAVAHLGLRWGVAPTTSWSGNRGNFYAMWTQARALRLNGTSTLVNGGFTFDWETGEDQASPGTLLGGAQEGYFPWLVTNQAGDGSWATSGFNGHYTANLNTAWGILVLQQTVFGPPPPDCDDIRDLALLIRSTAPGEFIFSSYRVIMGYMADAAARNCDIEDYRDVVTLLGRIIERTDGVVPPSDWMIPGAARDAIHDTALALRDEFATLLP